MRDVGSWIKAVVRRYQKGNNNNNNNNEFWWDLGSQPLDQRGGIRDQRGEIGSGIKRVGSGIRCVGSLITAPDQGSKDVGSRSAVF